MIKKLQYFLNRLFIFVKENIFIILSFIFGAILLFIVYKYLPGVIKSMFQKSDEQLQKEAKDALFRKEIHDAEKLRQQQEKDCAAIRVMAKRKNPRISVSRLEWQLAHATKQQDKEYLQKVITCFKQKPGPYDGEIEAYFKGKSRK